MPHYKTSLYMVKHDSDRRIRYDCDSKIYSIIMCNYFNALLYLLRISAAFCYVVAALIYSKVCFMSV